MHTFLSILSAPFWLFGAIALFAYFFGTVTRGKRELYGSERVPTFFFGIILLLIASFLVWI